MFLCYNYYDRGIQINNISIKNGQASDKTIKSIMHDDVSDDGKIKKNDVVKILKE